MILSLPQSQLQILMKKEYGFYTQYLNGRINAAEFLNYLTVYEVELLRHGVLEFTIAALRRTAQTFNPKLERVFETKADYSDAWVTYMFNFVARIFRHYGGRMKNTHYFSALANSISGFINVRMAREELDSYLSKFDTNDHTMYEDLIKAIGEFCREAGFLVQPGQGEYHLQVRLDNHPLFGKVVHSKQGQIYVSYKEYFTFVPLSDEVEEIKSEIIGFYYVILGAILKFQYVAKINGWKFAAKFKSNLGSMIHDYESLVCYFTDPSHGAYFRKIVIEEAKVYNIYVGRKNRSHSGFDFHFKVGGTMSHRQMIGTLISRSPEFQSQGFSSPNSFKAFVVEKTLEYGKISPEQMVSQLSL